ncbi:hypothetical protein RHGRI_008251 [Rhododendron griersonianum]|uniref:Uncharacterized protein n=1 Tax=Rhododendron griersonianum TaxID=479676 RepID=A0AAV6IKD3_9ERIC|nr:hypothetical protein RHGRI_029722 [Rhododendron griersonianum]KAG5541042.1 hypothetical protein RHGRI_021061 [Rhododendron griersonianum]KAG5554049.1 hypothetical protein RHGRI_011799 [Rhododendron griersonianum]KAG5558251.1 hypothetical protein RHGRI_008251 [Rhododendron griersonianum]
MEKGKATENTITRSLQNFDFHLNRNIPKSTRNTHSTLRSSILPIEKPKPPSLVGLCLGVVGKHFEDIIEDLGDIASNFPADIKVKLFRPPDIEHEDVWNDSRNKSNTKTSTTTTTRAMKLDDPNVKEVDPKTWAVSGFAVRAIIFSSSDEIANRFLILKLDS